jgi:hypothetical protein
VIGPRLLSYAVLTAPLMAFIWAHRVLPLLDYPDWLLQGAVLARMLRGEATPGYALVPFPVPNAISTLLIGPLALLAGAETAGKLVLSLYLVGFLAASLYFLAAETPALPWGLALVPFVYALNAPFFHGNLSYLLALALLLAGLGSLRRGRASGWLLAPLSLAIYLAHAAAFGVWVLAVAVLAPRRLAALAPALALLALYALDRLRAGRLQAGDGTGLRDLLVGKVGSLASYFAPFQAFYPFVNPADPLLRVAGALNLVALALVGALAVATAVAALRGRADRPLVALAGALALGFVLAPSTFAGIVSPGERLLYPALFLTLAAAVPARPWRRLGPALALVYLAQVVYLHGYAGRVAAEMSALPDRLSPLGPAFAVVHENRFDYAGQFSPDRAKPLYLPLHPVLMKIGHYRHVEAGSFGPIFDTGLIVGERDEPSLDSLAALRAAAPGQDELLIVGAPAGNRFIAAVLAATHRVVADADYALVMRR